MKLEVFKKYINDGLLRKVESECGNLVLYNYTDKCTFEKAWDHITLNARGTVYEKSTGNIVALAFPKFFNFGELELNEQQRVLKSTDFEVYEKMDGSLGIIYYYDGEWRVNTRGSFTSDQAIKAKELLSNYDLSKVPKTLTLLAEIIYPENRIIVDYGNIEKLTLLGIHDIQTGEHNNLLESIAELTGMDFAPKHKFNTINELQKHLETLDYNEEGYVVRFGYNDRVKFKSVEYLRLARILSNMSPLAFWEKMEQGKINREFLEQLPEEFRDECDNIADTLEEQYKKLTGLVHKQYDYCKSNMVTTETADFAPEKQLGLYLKNNKIEHSSAMFAVMKKNDAALEKFIMKTIKPTGNVMVVL